MAEQRTHFTAADYLRLEDLQGLYAKQQAAAEMFRETLTRDIPLEAPDLSQGAYTPAYPALFNVLEGNLRRLYEGFRTAQMQEARVWRGVEQDKPRLSAADANRWFETLELMRQQMETMCVRMPVTGMCNAGMNRELQHVRRVLR